MRARPVKAASREKDKSVFDAVNELDQPGRVRHCGPANCCALPRSDEPAPSFYGVSPRGAGVHARVAPPDWLGAITTPDRRPT